MNVFIEPNDEILIETGGLTYTIENGLHLLEEWLRSQVEFCEIEGIPDVDQDTLLEYAEIYAANHQELWIKI